MLWNGLFSQELLNVLFVLIITGITKSWYTEKQLSKFSHFLDFVITVEPLLRGHPEERPPPLEKSLDNVNLLA